MCVYRHLCLYVCFCQFWISFFEFEGITFNIKKEREKGVSTSSMNLKNSRVPLLSMWNSSFSCKFSLIHALYKQLLPKREKKIKPCSLVKKRTFEKRASLEICLSLYISLLLSYGIFYSYQQTRYTFNSLFSLAPLD